MFISWNPFDDLKNVRLNCDDTNFTPHRFIEHFEGTHFGKKNPFVGRSLSSICYLPHGYENDDGMQFFLNGLDQVLRNYGEEIWYFSILFNEDETDPLGYPQIYLRLQRWMTWMPNLKSLSIAHGMYPEEGWNSLEPLNQCLPPLERVIRENPMPTLEKLEFLSADNILSPIFNELIRQNSHISGLEMERGEPHENVYKYDFDHVLSSLPNLKQLGIHSFTEEELIKLEEKMGGLRLEKFQLTNPKGNPFHWGRLLGLIKGSYETLTDLVIELPFVGNKEGEDLLELTKSQDVLSQLIKLKRLMVFVGRPLFLDWLLPVKDTLQRLEFVVPPYLHRVKGYDKVVREQTIELFGFEERMEESSIWKAFEKLKIVKISEGYLISSEMWKECSRP